MAQRQEIGKPKRLANAFVMVLVAVGAIMVLVIIANKVAVLG
jgi:hypothetical protein